MNKTIITLLLLGLVLVVGCSNAPFSGVERAKVFDAMCQEKGMIYSHDGFKVPDSVDSVDSVYSCYDDKNERHTFKMDWSYMCKPK